MIVELILDLFLTLPVNLLDKYLPVIDFGQFTGAFDVVLVFLQYAAFFLPVGLFASLFAIIVAEEVFKIILSLLKLFLKLFIPGLG